MKIINNVKNSNSFNGNNLTQMFIYSKYYLEKHVDTLNSLNVFPVPDGDTGTNMAFTVNEILDLLQQHELEGFNVAEVEDRYLEIKGIVT